MVKAELEIGVLWCRAAGTTAGWRCRRCLLLPSRVQSTAFLSCFYGLPNTPNQPCSWATESMVHAPLALSKMLSLSIASPAFHVCSAFLGISIKAFAVPS